MPSPTICKQMLLGALRDLNDTFDKNYKKIQDLNKELHIVYNTQGRYCNEAVIVDNKIKLIENEQFDIIKAKAEIATALCRIDASGLRVQRSL